MKYGFAASFYQPPHLLTDTYLRERAKALDGIMKIFEEHDIREEYFLNKDGMDIHLIASSTRMSKNYNFIRSDSEVTFVTNSSELCERVKRELRKDFVKIVGIEKSPYGQKLEPGNSVLHMLYLLYGKQ